MSILDNIKNIGDELLHAVDKNVEDKSVTAAGVIVHIRLNQATRSAPSQSSFTMMRPSI